MWRKKNLLDAAEKAQIHTFGWPIGIVRNTQEDRPKPIVHGVFANIIVRDQDRISYDYWMLGKNGDFYLLKNLFEDHKIESRDKVIFFNTRIVRTTEVLLHCARLYANLDVLPATEIGLAIKYEGLGNRMLSSVGNRSLWHPRVAVENQIEVVTQFSLASIETQLVEKVKQYTSPLFA
jgi:hypothetical protein